MRRSKFIHVERLLNKVEKRTGMFCLHFGLLLIVNESIVRVCLSRLVTNLWRYDEGVALE